MMKNLLLVVFTLLTFSTFAQVEVRKCGTIHDAASYEQINQRAWEVSRMVHSGNHAELRDDEITWVPVKYHLISRVTQNTYPKVGDILGLHCRLNEEYAALNIQFYINGGLNFFQSDDAYNDPGANTASLNFQKNNQSVNVFIANNATTDGGIPGTVTLGYYSPGPDWIVLRKDQSNYDANTYVHEMGHFLSLPHTHNGWDSTSWAIWSDENPGQCAPNLSPSNTTVSVERQDGSNCEDGGDYICDTPPDYSFGISAGGCTWTEEVCDPNGDIVDPMEINYMSYFDCTSQIFTEGQGAQMLVDLASPARNYLKFDGGPLNENAAEVMAELNTPANGADVPFYNGVSFSWSDVPFTQEYILQIAENSGFTSNVREYLDWQPGAYISDLEANETYYWRVKGFNEASTCAPWSETRSFDTGLGTTGVSNISSVSTMSVAPNPVSAGSDLMVSLQSSEAFTADIQVVSVSGQVLNTIQNQNFNAGANTVTVSMDNLSVGLYFVRIRTEEGVMNRRVVVSK